jgi:ribose-phosphate pyrophosphokinase
MEDVVLLADKNSKAWKFSEKIQKHILNERKIYIELEKIEIKHFRNKEIDMHVPNNFRGKDVYFVQDSTKNPQEWWVELLIAKDLVIGSRAKSINFVLPNMLYSRKDWKDKSRVPLSARALAESISPGTSGIITMDLHSPQIQGFYPASTPVDNLFSYPQLLKYLYSNHKEDLENFIVVSPDVGGMARAHAFSKRFVSRKDIATIYKKRDDSGEVSEMRLVGDVRGKNALVIDDIIDSGGTLCKAADVLRENGAKKLMCYGTHGIFTKGTKELLSKFERVITSNTHYRNPGRGLEVVDMAPIFAETIYRNQKGLSVSSLFE